MPKGTASDRRPLQFQKWLSPPMPADHDQSPDKVRREYQYRITSCTYSSAAKHTWER